MEELPLRLLYFSDSRRQIVETASETKNTFISKKGLKDRLDEFLTKKEDELVEGVQQVVESNWKQFLGTL